MLLNVHSWHSLRYGTLSPERLAALLQQHGYRRMVLTDINNSAGVLELVHACRPYGIQALAGMEFRKGDTLLYWAIARNREGFREINELMTAANRRGEDPPREAPAFGDAFVVYPFGEKSCTDLRDNEYIGVPAAQLNRIRLETDHSRYVVWHPVSFEAGREAYKLHCQLRAIDHNILISQLQRHQAGGREEVMIPQQELLQAYRDFPELLRNTEALLDACSFDFDFAQVKNKQCFLDSRAADEAELLRLALLGLEWRYGSDHQEARERIHRELDIIRSQEFSSYFLITNDICRYAREKGYHYVGRGSGANSIVAYCLGITDVCPLRLNLYFERFMNPKRKIPPDFDIDFSWAVRDDIYRYLFEKYPGRVALLGAMSTFRSRSVMRELGKVYGLPKAEIDRMVRDPDHVLNQNEVVDMIRKVCTGMPADFPNQRTIHASGVLISELPLTYYCALDYPPKGLPTTQFDMYLAETIAFEKFDILSQRGLGHLKDCVALIAENRGETVRIDNPARFFTDERINEQLRSANTTGCFYIESPAMRQLIAKLDCRDYLTLVAASSIIRPGVASSGMMKAYIERHRNPDKESIPYLHPVLKEQLGETYGVMVYQEDVMKVGHFYGGLDLADADVLRRMMSGKSRSAERMREIGGRFFRHCREMNYAEETSREIWRQMESFAGFSFNKAHSASYAVESYQSLYLKTYYPLEFMVAVLNNYGGFYQRKVYVNEVKRAGATLHLPCVNHSRSNACIKGRDVYLGFDCLQHLDRQYLELIPQEREANGPYTGIEQLVLRTGITLDQLVVLVRAGALACFGQGKKELLWEAHVLLSSTASRRTDPVLFRDEGSTRPLLPALETSVLEDIYDELELIGFPVSGTMFDLVKTDYRGDVLARDLCAHEGKTVRIVGDFVCDKQLTSKNGQPMKFGTFFDAEGQFFDTVHFWSSLREFPFRGNGVYLIQGRVVLDFGYPGIEVEKIARLPVWNDPRSL